MVLQDLAQLIDKLHVRDFLDAPPWTSGPRRSVALANFAQRPGETAHDTRQRMHKVVMAFAGGNTNVGDRRIWCSFSRSPEERRRAGHASLVKKVVKEISEAHLDRLDVEYTSGTVWLEESRVASAVHPMGADPAVDYYIIDSKPERPWIDVTNLARQLRVDLKTVRHGIERLTH